MYKKKHIIPIYDVEIQVIINDTVTKCITEDKFLNSMSSYFKNTDSFYGFFVSMHNDDNGNNNLYVMLTYDVKTKTVAHESFHLACWILDRAGVTLTTDSEEAYAYLIGHIVNTLENDLIKANKKKDE